MQPARCRAFCESRTAECEAVGCCLSGIESAVCFAMPDKPSVYDRIGGDTAIESLVVAFYVRVMGDPDLAPFFRNTAIEKLHAMQREFFAMALGGPVSYTGRPLAHVHHGLGISRAVFGKFVGHLLKTLEDEGISESEAAEVIDRINSYSNEILGRSY